MPSLMVGLLTLSTAMKSQCGRNSKRLDWKAQVTYIGPARTSAANCKWSVKATVIATIIITVRSPPGGTVGRWAVARPSG